MRSYRKGTTSTRIAAGKAAKTRAENKQRHELEQDRMAALAKHDAEQRLAEEWARRVATNEHVLTIDGGPVEQ